MCSKDELKEWITNTAGERASAVGQPREIPTNRIARTAHISFAIIHTLLRMYSALVIAVLYKIDMILLLEALKYV